MTLQKTSVKPEDRTAMSLTLANGRNLSYSKYGKIGGRPFIMLHGTPGSRISMDSKLYHELDIEVIYPERAGYGNSTPNPNASFKSWADDMVELLNHLKINRVNISGVSGGGVFVLACIAFYPKRFNSASLIASVAPPQTPNYKDGMTFSNKLGFWMNKYAPFLVRWGSESFAKGLERSPESTFLNIMNQLCESDQKILQNAQNTGLIDVFINHLQEAFKNGVEGHVADMKMMSGKWDIPFENIGCPIHIWHGEEDNLSPIAGARYMAEWLPNTQTYFLPKYGHLLGEEDEVMKQILMNIFSTKSRK